jgi:hypothetical protein
VRKFPMTARKDKMSQKSKFAFDARVAKRERDWYEQLAYSEKVRSSAIMRRHELPSKKKKYQVDFDLVKSLPAKARTDPVRQERRWKLRRKKLFLDEKTGLVVVQRRGLSGTTQVHLKATVLTDAEKAAGKVPGVYVAKIIEKRGRGSKHISHTFDEAGELIEKTVSRSDGRLSEKWRLDSKGELIRTEYITTRWRDHPHSISDTISDLDSDGNRTVIQRLGSRGFREDVFIRNEKTGELTQTLHKGITSSAETTTSKGGTFATTRIKRLGSSKEYRSHADPDGAVITNLMSHNSLFSKSQVILAGDGSIKNASKGKFGRRKTITYFPEHKQITLGSRIDTIALTKEEFDLQAALSDAKARDDANVAKLRQSRAGVGGTAPPPIPGNKPQLVSPGTQVSGPRAQPPPPLPDPLVAQGNGSQRAAMSGARQPLQTASTSHAGSQNPTPVSETLALLGAISGGVAQSNPSVRDLTSTAGSRPTDLRAPARSTSASGGTGSTFPNPQRAEPPAHVGPRPGADPSRRISDIAPPAGRTLNDLFAGVLAPVPAGRTDRLPRSGERENSGRGD